MTLHSRNFLDRTEGEGTAERRDGEAAMEAEKEKAKEMAVSDLLSALVVLADAADDVGVHFFDTDSMSPEVEAMRRATTNARNSIAAARAAGVKP